MTGWRARVAGVAGLLVGFVLAASPGAAVAQPAPRAPVPAFPYEDRLIEGADASDPATPGRADAAQPTGFRATVLEARGYARHSSATRGVNEGGLYLLHRRETINHGELFVEASWRNASEDPLFPLLPGGSSHRFSIRQVGMPLTRDWSLGNAAGLFRSAVPDAFSSAYRFNLPSALLTGVGTYWSSLDTAWQAEHGEFTQIEGLQGLGARRVGGRASAAAVSHRIDERWRAGLHVQHVDTGNEAGRFSAATAVLSYASLQPGLRWRWQGLTDQHLRRGHWVEGEWRSGWHASRWSLWRFDPGLQWFATLLSSGQRGVSWRHDFSDPSHFWGVGIERVRNDGFDASRAANDVTLLSGNTGWRIDRRWSAGMTGLWRESRPAFDDGFSQAQRYLSVSAHVQHVRAGRSDRWQVTAVNTEGATRSRVGEVAWTHEWRRDDDSVWSGSLGVMHTRDENGTRWRPMLGLAVTTPLASGGSLAGTLRHARDADRYTTATTWSGSLAWTQPLADSWSVITSLSLNRLGYDTQLPLFTALPTRLRERAAWVTLRYAQAGGIPYLAGQPGDGRGAGAIVGVVFQDENRDGRRQPGESGAAGVTVWLDNLQSTVTGPDGRFEFPLVRTGRHAVRVDASTVRLPWGVLDERASRIEVQPRESATLALPLVKVGE